MVSIRSYTRHDRTWVEKANVHFYQNRHKFDATFTDAVESALDELEGRISDPESCFLIAEHDGTPVGCIFLSTDQQSVGRIRLFFVDEDFRGKGIGRNLLQAVLESAMRREFEAVRVSTFERHPEACRLYEKSDFKLGNAHQMTAFGNVMQQRDYELTIR